MERIYYSGFTLEDRKQHVTWMFGKNSTLPCHEGEPVMIKVVGEYRDEDIHALIVNVVFQNGTILTHQPNGTVLHITKSAINGASNKDSGIRATNNGWEKKKYSYSYLAYADIVHKKVSILTFLKSFF